LLKLSILQYLKGFQKKADTSAMKRTRWLFSSAHKPQHRNGARNILEIANNGIHGRIPLHFWLGGGSVFFRRRKFWLLIKMQKGAIFHLLIYIGCDKVRERKNRLLLKVDAKKERDLSLAGQAGKMGRAKRAALVHK
jgi:hypothetical protein